ncbi:unnamed protein product [Vitrella brassicaformis CCMP3155]|uniref:Chaperone protein DnaJ n=1 Tax=Vitrella brassicaformis (strain CCMP3155) TaxID=1169540 RepID=A0A0G4FKA9_VITBC|nr:unnamed protein product [Vitrella brassicaformis CCMP3155]|eukprot:CEM13814.1 unnamed protein product [Vitrella brassicaformis CCMP3155]
MSRVVCQGTAKDPYATLGVGRGASTDEIKKAFRHLAKKYHPDINKDEGSQQKMAEITSAYEMLSDPKKRDFYDKTGMSADEAGHGAPGAGGFEGFHGDPSWMFSDFANIFGRMGSAFSGFAQASRGEDIQTEVTIDFMEGINGCDKTLRYQAKAQCGTCNGTGCAPGTGLETCRACNGQGVRRLERGPLTIGIPCQTCNGTGRVIKHPCKTCKGSGTVLESKTFTLDIPAGVKSGMEMRIPNAGHAGEHGGKPGHLFVTIKVRAHPLFRWLDDDIHVNVPISLKQSFLGGEVEVPTLQEPIKLTVPPGTSPDTVKILKGKGPRRTDGRGYGHLILHFYLQMPGKLNTTQRELIQQFDTLEQENEKGRRGGAKEQPWWQERISKGAAS